MLKDLFKRFVKEKLFLENVSPRTIGFYQQSYKAFKRTVGIDLPNRLTLNDFIIKLREAGNTPGGMNVCIQGMNSFLTWLWKNEHLPERLRMKELRTEQKVIPIYSMTELKRFLSFKPKKTQSIELLLLCAFLLIRERGLTNALPLRKKMLIWIISLSKSVVRETKNE